MERHNKTITYWVNGERESTKQEVLTVGTILSDAEFTPITDYTLRSENPKRDYDSNYDEEVELHDEQRFEVLYKGPTPTS
ncbi:MULTISPECIES: hypothetical protein [Ferrimicrobium]|jgi:hypothetical protein|uniref:Multiubiquitin n=1 Tax=Ferrimicrobium acidiphilum TaxID=121039 RepID=A0ABV3XZ55_9ACTN|nr:hypothetical protein [Ferrimicrobium sp.]